MHVVVADDRPSHEDGVRVVVASVRRHLPTATVVVRAPRATPTLRAWLTTLPRTALDDRPLPGSGWDVKPGVLLEQLEHHDEVLWLDSDLLVSGDLGARLARVPPETLVVSGETWLGQALGGLHRTQAWGLHEGRPVPTTANTGVLRVTRRHRALLRTWREMLDDERYRSAQASPWFERPLHLLGDQEVLTALLGADAHASLPLDVLRQGTEVAQCFGPAGWSPGDRLRAVLRGRPPLVVHAMGARKPYAEGRPGEGRAAALRHAYDRAHLRQGAYAAGAAALREETGLGLAWAGPAVGWRTAALRGLPLAVLDATVRRARRRVGAGRFAVVGGSAEASRATSTRPLPRRPGSR